MGIAAAVPTFSKTRCMKSLHPVSVRELWISTAGGLLAIFLVLLVGNAVNGELGILTTTSMGATVVLLFAAPHSAMSQPWAVFGGHLISALAGVASARWLSGEPVYAGTLAVVLALAGMYSLRCLHAPGGATAIYPVLGGAGIDALGWTYVLNPILLDVGILLVVATLFNLPFPWRRYPQAWLDIKQKETTEAMIPHSHLVYALSQVDTFIDISEDDLLRIYALAVHGKQPDEVVTNARDAARGADANTP